MGTSSKQVENPKDTIGSDKLPIHLFPATAVALGSLANLHGNLKYGRNNFRAAAVRYTVYLDAIIRHAQAALEGEDVDPESGLPHEAHILASAAILCDAEACGKRIDDRNYAGGFFRGFVNRWTPHVKRLKEQFKDKNPKHWSIQDNKEYTYEEGLKLGLWGKINAGTTAAKQE